MSLSAKDIERIREVVRSEMHPFTTSIEILNLTVYGIKGTNGLSKSVKDQEKWRYLATGALMVISSATFWVILSNF